MIELKAKVLLSDWGGQVVEFRQEDAFFVRRSVQWLNGRQTEFICCGDGFP